jgi:hypothetical protein
LIAWRNPTPRNAGWLRDLSVAYEKIGDVQMAQGDLIPVAPLRRSARLS